LGLHSASAHLEEWWHKDIGQISDFKTHGTFAKIMGH